MSFIIGKKTDQEQWFDEARQRRVITVCETPECYITALKTPEKDGYWAVQLGFKTDKSPKNINKAVIGKTKQAGIKTPLSFFKEVRLTEKYGRLELVKDGEKTGIKLNDKIFFLGSQILPKDMFTAGDIVEVSGISKGKGFQGVVKRHKFSGGPKTHGQSDRQRAPGSIGAGTTPGRVIKGKRMAGRMGGERVTVKGLKVVEVTADSFALQGLVPGGRGSILLVKKQIN